MPNFPWPFFRHLPPKKSFSTRYFPILHQKFSHSQPKIFWWPLLVVYHQKITLHHSHFKEKFPPNIFRWLFLVIIYPKKFLSTQFFFKCSGLQDFYTFLLCLSKRSRTVSVRHDLLYDTTILTYKIDIPHFHFPVRRTITKNPVCNYSIMYAHIKGIYIIGMVTRD